MCSNPVQQHSSEIAALKTELAEVKTRLTALQSVPQTTTASYATAAAQPGSCCRQQKQTRRIRQAISGLRRPPKVSGATTAVSQTTVANSGNDESNGEKERIPGTRRVWGTLPTTQAGAVVSTLKKLTKAGSKVRVYRKFRTSRQGKACWWFNLKGEENDLCALEGEWDAVTLQTNWKQEHCYKPTAVSNCNNFEPTPAEHDEHDELVQPSGSSATEVSSPNEPKNDGEPDNAKLSSSVDQNKAGEHPGDHCDDGQPSHT